MYFLGVYAPFARFSPLVGTVWGYRELKAWMLHAMEHDEYERASGIIIHLIPKSKMTIPPQLVKSCLRPVLDLYTYRTTR